MISIRNIVKQYAGHKALSDVSMDIKKGEVFGLLGPNGAGKTSLIRIINQITGPDSGEILFNGTKLSESHIGKIGYLPEERGLYKKMEIGEQILYLAQLKGMPREEAKARAVKWFRKLEIESWWNKKIEELSKGMQQKAQFIATVLHEPELIILDEPFSGFDPINAELIKNEILELNKNGATIIFSTHRMESVEELCDSIALINLSHKILDGKVTEIKNQYRTGTYIVEYEGNNTDAQQSSQFELLKSESIDFGTRLQIKLRQGVHLNNVLAELLPKVQLLKVEEKIPSMNEIFIETVNKQTQKSKG